MKDESRNIKDLIAELEETKQECARLTALLENQRFTVREISEIAHAKPEMAKGESEKVTHNDPENVEPAAGERIRSDKLRDVLDWTQAEKQIPNLAEMISLAPGSITVHDFSGRFLYANQKTFEIHGYSEEEFMDINLHALDVPASADLISDRMNQINETGYAAFEVAHYHKQGHEIPLEVYVRRVEWNGEPAFLSIAIDITDRKNAEKALKNREILLNQIFNLLPIGLWFADENGTLTLGNPAGIKIWGSEPRVAMDEYGVFKARRLPEGTPVAPDDWALVHTIREGITVVDEMLEIEAFDGVKKIILNYSAPVISEQGKIMGAIVVNQDITDKLRAEEALRESEEKYRVLFDTFPLGITIADLAGNIVENNRRATELLGITRDELTKRQISGEPWQIIRPDGTRMPAHEFASTRAIKEQRLVQNVEMGVVKPNGDITWINVTAAPLQHKESGVAIAYNDITDRRKAEQELKRIEWLLTSNLESDGEKSPAYLPPYGNLVALNTSRLILDSVGEQTLTDIIGDYLGLLDTSAAVYERNGDYALGIFSSAWCRFMDSASHKLCNTTDNFEALNSGKWHCHESCWNQAAKTALETGHPVDIECAGGINLYAVPIKAGDEIIGVISVGYGDPPRDDSRLTELAEFYGVSAGELRQNAMAYESRPPYIVNLAKQRLLVSARLIGNIAGRKMAEKELIKAKEMAEESEQKHRALIDQMLEGLVVDDGNGIIRFVNPMFCKMTGYQDSDLVGKSGYDLLLRKEDIEIVKKKDQERKKGLSDQYEMGLVTSSGDIRTFWFHVTPVLNDLGEVSASMSLVTDITDQKKTETARRIQLNIARSIQTIKTTSELLGAIRLELEQLFDTTNFFVALYNPQTETLKQLFFYDEMDSFDEWDANQSISGAVVKTGKSILLQGDQITEFCSDNNLVVLGSDSACWLGVPIVLHEKVGGVMVIQHYSDPTAYNETDVALFEMIAHETGVFLEKQMMFEDLIRAKEKAEESDRLKTAFLANMSHEIRTPMNGIMGFAELLKEPGLSGEEQQEYIDIIEKSGHRMLGIINDIIDISKIEAGLQDLHFSDVNVADQLKETCAFFSREADAKGLVLSLNNRLNPSEFLLRTDVQKFNAILNNLIKNAIKFTDAGTVAIECVCRDNYYEFSVKDTGIGISSERQDAVFERFIQGDIEDKMARQGAGLGLSIAKAFVELLGGTIWMNSKEGVGSEFSFTIPCALKSFRDEKLVPGIEPLITGRKKLNILIVEDDEWSEKLLEIKLADFSRKTLKARSGSAAVGLAEENPDLDLIFMDIQLPEMNGYEATRQIKTSNTGVIIIAHTALCLLGDKEKALAAGCDDYLSKPLKDNELRHVLHKYFQL